METKKWENLFGNAIYLSDSEEEITKKVMSAVTDPNRIKKDDLGNPDICMVAYYEAHPELVNKFLKEGTEKARKTAKETMKKVKEAMKLNYFED